jgi:hypothetical protein
VRTKIEMSFLRLFYQTTLLAHIANINTFTNQNHRSKFFFNILLLSRKCVFFFYIFKKMIWNIFFQHVYFLTIKFHYILPLLLNIIILSTFLLNIFFRLFFLKIKN